MPRLYPALCASCLALGFMVGRLPQFDRLPPQPGQTADDITDAGKQLTQGLIGGARPELTPDERWVVLNAYAERLKNRLSDEGLVTVCGIVKRAALAREMLEEARRRDSKD